MLDLSEEAIAEFGMTFGIGAFMLYMLFVIFDLARKSKAGRLGTFVLFFVLAFGMIGFVAKSIIAKLLGLSETNVGTILHRAITTLRERWPEEVS